MQMQITAFIATSLDGFIARVNGDIDWLEQANSLVPQGEDCGYSNFFLNIDCIVLGRKTFEKILSFKEWPYGDKCVFVMSKKGVTIPERLSRTVSSTDRSPISLRNILSQRGFKSIYVDGGQIIRAFLNAGLLDEITITRIPILIHSGIPLFGWDTELSRSTSQDFWFELKESRAWPFGFVQDILKVKALKVELNSKTRT